MAKSSEETSQQPSAQISTVTLTVAQQAFAEVVGRELARQWFEQQSPVINKEQQQFGSLPNPEHRMVIANERIT